jgi:hypothetical protein
MKYCLLSFHRSVNDHTLAFLSIESDFLGIIHKDKLYGESDNLIIFLFKRSLFIDFVFVYSIVYRCIFVYDKQYRLIYTDRIATFSILWLMA